MLLGLYEIALFGGGGVTDFVYGWAPMWFWATITVAAILGMPALYAPEIWRWLKRRGKRQPTDEETKAELLGLKVEFLSIMQRSHDSTERVHDSRLNALERDREREC